MYYLCHCKRDVQVYARPPLVADKIVINPANNRPFSRQNIQLIPVGSRKSSLQ